MPLSLALRPTDPAPVHKQGDALRRPAGDAPPSASVEMRLKTLIESVPASIVVASPDGTLLAANRETLTLVGVGRLEEVLGSRLSERVAAGDRERFDGFVARVCSGEAATLEYELAGPDGMKRIVETSAVPLSRAGMTPAAFLGVTWDLSERLRAMAAGQHQAQARCELLEAQLHAQRDAYEPALRDAKAAYDQIAQERASERQALGQMVRDVRTRLQARLAETEEEHERAAAQWEAEREDLKAQLRASESRQVSASAQAVAEQHARQLAMLEALEAQHRAALEARAADHERLEAALKDALRRVGDLEEERTAERTRFENVLAAERARREALMEERERWLARLTDFLQTLAKPSDQDPLPIAPLFADTDSAASDPPDTDGQPVGDSQWAL